MRMKESINVLRSLIKWEFGNKLKVKSEELKVEN